MIKVILSVGVVVCLVLVIGFQTYDVGHTKGMYDMGVVLCAPNEPGYDHSQDKYVCYNGETPYKPNITLEVGQWSI